MDYLAISTFYGINGASNVDLKIVGGFIHNGISDLPWFFKFPLRIYIIAVGVLLFVRFLYPVIGISDMKKHLFYINIVLKLPFAGSLDKLIRSLGFLKIYDLLMGKD